VGGGGGGVWGVELFHRCLPPSERGATNHPSKASKEGEPRQKEKKNGSPFHTRLEAKVEGLGLGMQSVKHKKVLLSSGTRVYRRQLQTKTKTKRCPWAKRKGNAHVNGLVNRSRWRKRALIAPLQVGGGERKRVFGVKNQGEGMKSSSEKILAERSHA